MSVEPLDLAAVQQQLLDDDSILVEYALGDERSYVWLVGPHKSDDVRVAFEKCEIEESAKRLYHNITAFQPLPGESVEQLTERRQSASRSIPSETKLLSKLVLGPFSREA
jgi:hypothetical protein